MYSGIFLKADLIETYGATVATRQLFACIACMDAWGPYIMPRGLQGFQKACKQLSDNLHVIGFVIPEVSAHYM